MTRNLKAFGVSLIAIFALSAVVVSAASAQNGRLTSDGPVTLIGTQTGAYGSGANALTAFNQKTECEKATYTGHKIGSKTELLASGSESATINPHYGVCTTAGFPTTVDMNGCDYTFDLKPTNVHAADSYAVTSTVHCSGSANIVVTVFGSAAKHAANEPFCEVEITEKTSYEGLSARDTTNGHLDVTGTLKGIEAHKKSPTGSILCPTETTTTAELHLDITVEGKNAAGATTAIAISHN